MEVHYPMGPEQQARRFSPKDIALIACGLLLAVVGFFLWWGDLLFQLVGKDEWTAAEKKQSLTELIKRAESQGVIEPTPEEKLRALGGNR